MTRGDEEAKREAVDRGVVVSSCSSTGSGADALGGREVEVVIRKAPRRAVPEWVLPTLHVVLDVVLFDALKDGVLADRIAERVVRQMEKQIASDNPKRYVP